MAGISPATELARRPEFAAGSGTDATTSKTYTALCPPGTYEKGDAKQIHDIQPLTAYTLWDVDDNSAISSDFDFAVLQNYGGVNLFYEVVVDGGTVNEKVDKRRSLASSEDRIDAVQANAAEAAGAFATSITGRVTQIRVYNPDAAEVGKVKMPMFAEPEA